MTNTIEQAEPLTNPARPYENLVIELALADEALQRAINAMIHDPAMVSLVGERVLKAHSAVRKARRTLGAR